MLKNEKFSFLVRDRLYTHSYMFGGFWSSQFSKPAWALFLKLIIEIIDFNQFEYDFLGTREDVSSGVIPLLRMCIVVWGGVIFFKWGGVILSFNYKQKVVIIYFSSYSPHPDISNQ